MINYGYEGEVINPGINVFKISDGGNAIILRARKFTFYLRRRGPAWKQRGMPTRYVTSWSRHG